MHVAHLLVQLEPATMLLVLVRFFQQFWQTMIQPRVLWVAPRVLMLVPVVPHSAHVPMVWCMGVDGIKVSPGEGMLSKNVNCYIKSRQV